MTERPEPPSLSPIGPGRLRADPAFGQTWCGVVTVAGFPYAARAVLESTVEGSVIVLTLEVGEHT